MKRTFLAMAALLAACLFVAQAKAQKAPATGKPGAKSDAKSAPADRAREADEKAIRAAADAFVKSYNAHDAKAIAGLFIADAELVDEQGDARQGRGEIERIFAGVFQQFPQAKVEIAIKSIRFLSPALAVEDGLLTVTHDP